MSTYKNSSAVIAVVLGLALGLGLIGFYQAFNEKPHYTVHFVANDSFCCARTTSNHLFCKGGIQFHYVTNYVSTEKDCE